MKEFQIKYNGGTAPLQINERLKAGTILKMTKPPIVKFKAGQTMPDIDYEEYYYYLASNVITQAPWPVQNIEALKQLDGDVFYELCRILGDELPLQRFLYPVLKLVFGRDLEMPELPSRTESTLKPSSAESPSGR